MAVVPTKTILEVKQVITFDIYYNKIKRIRCIVKTLTCIEVEGVHFDFMLTLRVKNEID